MATNKLMEAAAEILASSKKSASAMPPQKLGGEVQDLGGPTPQNSKPDDDSNKIDAGKGATQTAAPQTKPSNASPDTQQMLGGGKKTMKEDEEASKAVIAEKSHEDEEEEDEDEEKEEMKKKMKEDVDALFSDDSTISEEFKSKVSTIFEARVTDRVTQVQEEIERGIEYKKALTEAVKLEITREVCAGLTDTQAEKVKSLAESVDFSTADEYKQKLETIRENYFPSGVKKADETQLHEQVEEAAEQKEISDPFVAAVSKAISKTIK